MLNANSDSVHLRREAGDCFPAVLATSRVLYVSFVCLYYYLGEWARISQFCLSCDVPSVLLSASCFEIGAVVGYAAELHAVGVGDLEHLICVSSVEFFEVVC